MELVLEEHVYWRVDRILGERLRRSALPRDQREDIRAEVLLKVVNRLQRLVRGIASEVDGGTGAAVPAVAKVSRPTPS